MLATYPVSNLAARARRSEPLTVRERVARFMESCPETVHVVDVARALGIDVRHSDFVRVRLALRSGPYEHAGRFLYRKV